MGNVTEIVVVLDVQDMDWIVAAPLSVEVEFADDTVVVLPAQVSPLAARSQYGWTCRGRFLFEFLIGISVLSVTRRR